MAVGCASQATGVRISSLRRWSRWCPASSCPPRPKNGSAATAIILLNYHQDHFGRVFGIRTADGAIAHTACVGFGLERIALALYRQQGFTRAGWSASAREALGL